MKGEVKSIIHKNTHKKGKKCVKSKTSIIAPNSTNEISLLNNVNKSFKISIHFG